MRSDLWFNDGNIVLIADVYAFKIHRGQLQRHSEFFQGMFDIPQPEEQDLVDGCPYVEMLDAPDDLYHFLSALYDGMHYSDPRPAHFARLAAVLRLSAKYLVPHLHQQCLERLTLDWPVDLEGWDKRETEALGSKDYYSPRQYTPHPILIIELAIELDLRDILPSAFYDLSRYGPSKIMYGTLGIPSVLVSPSEDPRYVCLSNQLLVRSLQGREAGQQFLIDFLVEHVETRQPSPESHPCVQGFQEVYFDIFRCIGGVSVGRDADPLFTLAQGIDKLMRYGSGGHGEGERARSLMCGKCRVALVEDLKRGREAAWMSMPGWFGLVEPEEGSKEVDAQ
ncbi:hypothetical protein BDP27DRAFT_1381861 [Rhodocollybia butyracea]|uniref:BTB domain-containing protein n=1 Tax=Rhodocollybia butyracea TaxID=206335 RepID=A0A9P5Q1S7_9AGAR|nr:hypothetical protein BDP27DRAFT_1381861 [Rhodocollybia butyracea]